MNVGVLDVTKLDLQCILSLKVKERKSPVRAPSWILRVDVNLFMFFPPDSNPHLLRNILLRRGSVTSTSEASLLFSALYSDTLAPKGKLIQLIWRLTDDVRTVPYCCKSAVKVLQSACNFNPIPKEAPVYRSGALIFSGNHHFQHSSNR